MPVFKNKARATNILSATQLKCRCCNFTTPLDEQANAGVGWSKLRTHFRMAHAPQYAQIVTSITNKHGHFHEELL